MEGLEFVERRVDGVVLFGFCSSSEQLEMVMTSPGAGLGAVISRQLCIEVTSMRLGLLLRALSFLTAFALS